MDALLIPELIGEPQGTPFVAGCAANQVKFYDRFDAIVLLSAPLDVLATRLASRTSNDFGTDPAERARIIDHVRTVEPLLSSCTMKIDTVRPLLEVVAAFETLATSC